MKKFCPVWQAKGIFSFSTKSIDLKITDNGGKCHHFELKEKQRSM